MIHIDTTNDNNWIITNIAFTDFNEGESKYNLLPNDIYLPHSDASVAQNIEPEYTSCDFKGKYCYIALQENNAVAILDIEGKTITAIYTLGTKDYSKYGLDASDRDDTINIATYGGLYGLRMPDNIKYFQSINGNEYFVTANEGDSKSFDESRVSDLYLNQTIFGNTTQLQNDNNLGRLKIVNQLGYTMKNDIKIYNKLYAWSSRDFTIFKIKETDSMPMIFNVYSSLSDFELKTADQLNKTGFNSNGFNPSFDSRSDDKGPEPECVTIGKCTNGRLYAFIGLERVGGIMVYDITDIDNGNVTFVEYENNRNFSIYFDADTRPPSSVGDIGPEQIRFIEGDIPLLIVANAESASVTMYRIDCQAMNNDDSDDSVSTTKTMITTGHDIANKIECIQGAFIMIGAILFSY